MKRKRSKSLHNGRPRSEGNRADDIKSLLDRGASGPRQRFVDCPEKAGLRWPKAIEVILPPVSLENTVAPVTAALAEAVYERTRSTEDCGVFQGFATQTPGGSADGVCGFRQFRFLSCSREKATGGRRGVGNFFLNIAHAFMETGSGIGACCGRGQRVAVRHNPNWVWTLGAWATRVCLAGAKQSEPWSLQRRRQWVAGRRDSSEMCAKVGTQCRSSRAGDRALYRPAWHHGSALVWSTSGSRAGRSVCRSSSCRFMKTQSLA